MSETESPAEVTAVVFKKREIRQNNNIRRKVGVTTEKQDEDQEEDSGINTEKINEFKLLKTLKSRDVGIEYNGEGQIAKRDNDDKSSNAQELGGRLKNQFSSQMDHGIGVNVAHEHIMQKYIDEKLGVRKEEDGKAKRPVDSSGLYTIPSELIVESKLTSTQVRLANEEGSASSWSTGIAEVALPDSYRERNRQATEAAAAQRRLEEEQRLAQQSKNQQLEFSQYHRFQHPREIRSAYPSKGGESAVVASAPAAVGDSQQTDNDSTSLKRKLHSTDDATVKRYRQQLASRR